MSNVGGSPYTRIKLHSVFFRESVSNALSFCLPSSHYAQDPVTKSGEIPYPERYTFEDFDFVVDTFSISIGYVMAK